jgi:hypothetical protein
VYTKVDEWRVSIPALFKAPSAAVRKFVQKKGVKTAEPAGVME